MASRPSLSLVVASALFFVSGALGLGYEIVWIRKATLVVGASQAALATVLTSFFLGLGLGSLAVGRWRAIARWSPLVVYGAFEIAIGAFALLFPTLFHLVEALYGTLHPLVAGSAPLVFALRFGLLFVLFLLPTFFMGGTLPLLLDGLVDRERAIATRTTLLYGINTLGAVAGVLATSYVAIPLLGTTRTSIAGGIGNLLVGAIALAWFRGSPGAVPAHEQPTEVLSAARLGVRSPLVWLAFASGLLAIGYQVAWARYFSLFQAGNVYLTAVLLAVYLLALALGSFVLAPLLAARVEPLRLVALLQPLVPLSALWLLESWQRVALRFAMVAVPGGAPSMADSSYEVVPSWQLLSETLDGILVAPLAQVALVVFVPVLLLATALPALVVAAARRRDDLRAASGTLFFANTLGSSAGGLATGWLLLPLLGLRGTLVALALGSIGVALGAAACAPRAEVPARAETRRAQGRADQRAKAGTKDRRPSPSAHQALYAQLGYCAAVLVACGLLVRDDVTRRTVAAQACGGTATGDSLIDLVEGPLTTTYVFDGKDRLSVGSGNVCLAVVEHNVASTQAVQGHVPALFYPRAGAPVDALGICLGSGQSFGALLLYDVRRLDVVDISAEMIDLSLKYFAEYNHALGTDPRVRFHLDDGRHFVARAASDSYDVVSMEPPPPAAEGVYSLYSTEFYQQVDRILRDGGVFMQWLPLYRVTPLDARGIVKTQAAVFPYTFVFKVGRLDFMVVSFKGDRPPLFSVAELRKRLPVFESERLVKGARWEPGARHDMASLEGALSTIVSGPDDLAAIEIEPYRDDDERLSYSSGDRDLLRRYEGGALAYLSFVALPVTPYADLQKYFDEPLPVEELESERARSLSLFAVPDPVRVAALERAYAEATDPAAKADAAIQLASAYDAGFVRDRAYEWLEKAIAALPDDRRGDHVMAARRIVHDRIAILLAEARARVDELARRYPGATLVRAMDLEVREYEKRDAARRSRYWLDDGAVSPQG